MFQHASCCQGNGVVPPALALAPQHAEVEVLVHASRFFRADGKHILLPSRKFSVTD